MNNDITRRSAPGGLQTQRDAGNNAILLDDVRLMWRNFSGEKTRYNDEGKRNFVVFLTEEMGVALRDQGFNIKYLEPREEGETGQYFLKVNVNYNSHTPPKVYFINSKGKRLLPPDLVGMADGVDIDKAEVIINPYRRKDGDTTTAYLKTVFIWLREDELELKYADVPDLDFPVGSSQTDNVLVWHESTPQQHEEEKYLELEA